jgi:MFS transporter, MHS family, shikimate and dehydroshikimate transport protein
MEPPSTSPTSFTATPPTAPCPPAVDRRTLVEAIVASTIGTTIEWYDFFLYGIVTSLVIQPLFFPGEAPFIGQMLAFSTYAVGFAFRPLGGVIFGWMGDRVGRKSTLVTTLLLMGISTMLIGVLPGHAQLGVTAPILLVVLRCIQGIGVGGEWGGSVLLALESGHTGRRGFYASWPQAGVPLGLLSSTGMVTLFEAALSREDFLAWGWRVPFLLSGVLIVVGLLIRIRILETPLFAQLQETNQVAMTPVRDVIRGHWREILLAAGSRTAENACFYLFTVYVIAYATTVLAVAGSAESATLGRAALLGINLAAGLEFFTIPLFGLLSDRWSRRGIYVLGCFVLAGFAYPYFALLETRQPALIVLAVIVSLNTGHAMLYSVQASLIPELFGTRLRYSGASIGYQLGAPLAGGVAPLIAATLVQAFPGQFWPLAAYIILISGISFVCVLLLAETSRKDISAE